MEKEIMIMMMTMSTHIVEKLVHPSRLIDFLISATDNVLLLLTA
jgi:hypothetical protein